MKKKIMSLVLTVIFALSCATTASAAKVGDVIGKTLYTDIVASINGRNIASYNYNGHTMIVAEDLRNYGFDVTWNGTSRTLNVDRDSVGTNITSTYTAPKVSSKVLGTKATDVLYTDIKTYVCGKKVDGYNIGGLTVINFNTLSAFGNVVYNNDTRRLDLYISIVTDPNLIICSECSGTGVFCPLCDSTGDCYKCGGDGKVPCYLCKGTDRCDRCKGTSLGVSGEENDCYSKCKDGKCRNINCENGYTDCGYNCNGTGNCKQCGGNPVCYMCGGAGGYAANETLPDKVEVTVSTCSKCGGDGRYCDTCEGNGVCKTCKGVASVCTSCNGKDICSTCEGTGERGYNRKCYSCKGDKKCHRCYNGYDVCYCSNTRLCIECFGSEESCGKCAGSGIVKEVATEIITPPPVVCSFCGGYGCSYCTGITDSCDNCGGSGRDYCSNCVNGSCSECGGWGYTSKYVEGTNKHVDCPKCTGGICRTCGGDHEVDCRYC